MLSVLMADGRALAPAALMLGVLGLFARPAHADDKAPAVAECCYAVGRLRPPAPPGIEAATVNEAEPNDSPALAQRIALGKGAGFDDDYIINGSILTNADVDFFRIRVRRGDVIGAALLGGAGLDPFLAITDASDTALIGNNDHALGATTIESLYPASSPFPGGSAADDAVLTWVCPADGAYFVRAQSRGAASSGGYSIDLRVRPALLATEATGRQIIFVDFDGATINAFALFGVGNATASLSAMPTFLSNWGLTNNTANQNAVIDATLAVIQENLSDLAAQNPRMSFELRNSRDHADPFGQLRVSRVIIGGTVNELGIPTIGISESIDPGNWDTSETAVVLLDFLSASCPNANSINCIQRAPGVGIVPAIGRVIGNIASHEIGHFIGCWHTNNGNVVTNIMDAGGNGLLDEAGAGADGVFGNADDIDPDFVADGYDLFEAVATGVENTPLRNAFGLFFIPKLFVNRANNGFEDGSPTSPFNTVVEAVNVAGAGGETWIYLAAANYPAPFQSSRWLRFKSWSGGSGFVGRAP